MKRLCLHSDRSLAGVGCDAHACGECHTAAHCTKLVELGRLRLLGIREQRPRRARQQFPGVRRSPQREYADDVQRLGDLTERFYLYI